VRQKKLILSSWCKSNLRKRLAITSELNYAPGGVICHRKALGMGYRAITQVKGLCPEITIVLVANTVHIVAGRSLITVKRGYENPTGSETVARYQSDNIGTWENQCIPRWVCNHNLINGKDLQSIHWWSDKPIVAGKFRNGNGTKGFTGKLLEEDTTVRHRAGVRLSTKPKPVTYSPESREVFLKSRVRKICKHGSVRGFIAFSERRWL